MNYLLLFIKVLFIIVGISGVLAKLFDRKIGYTIPMTFLIIVFLFYFSGLILNSFIITKYLLYISSLVCFIYTLIKATRNSQFRNLILSNGLFSFIIVLIIFFIYCYRYQFTIWDEFSHWGPMARTMFKTDSFYTLYPRIGGDHIEYPPYFSIVELFFCYLYGSYSEAICSLALHVFEFSLIIPYFSDTYEKRKKIEKILFLVLVFLIIISLGGEYFRTLYLDVPIAIVSIFPIMIIINEKIKNTNYKIVMLILSMSSILIIKEIGIAFFLCDIFIVLYYLFAVDSEKNFNKILVSLIIVLIPFIVWLSWQSYYKIYVETTQFDLLRIISNLNIRNILETENNTIRSILNNLKNMQMIYSKINISYLSISIIAACLLFILIFKDKYHKKENIGFTLLIIIANIGYICLLIVLYCYSFSDAEKESLASFHRYFSSILIYSLLAISFHIFNNNYLAKKSSFLLICINLVIIFNFNSFISIVEPSFLLKHYPVSSDKRKTSEYMSYYIEKNSKVLIISSNYFENINLFTYLTENKFIFDAINPITMKNKNISIKELFKYDYVIFDEDIIDTVNELFLQYSNIGEIYNDVLYKVLKENGELKLIMMC